MGGSAGLLPPERCFVCAGAAHAEAVARLLPQLGAEQYLGEPCGRDTLNALGFSAAVLARRDPEAIFGVFTADHVIEPVGRFQEIVEQGYALVERQPDTLVTFGISPTGPATGYGYLELGDNVPLVPPVPLTLRVRESRHAERDEYLGRGGCGSSAKNPTWKRRGNTSRPGPSGSSGTAECSFGGPTPCWSASAATRPRTTPASGGSPTLGTRPAGRPFWTRSTRRSKKSAWTMR